MLNSMATSAGEEVPADIARAGWLRVPGNRHLCLQDGERMVGWIDAASHVAVSAVVGQGSRQASLL